VADVTDFYQHANKTQLYKLRKSDLVLLFKTTVAPQTGLSGPVDLEALTVAELRDRIQEQVREVSILIYFTKRLL
jgi:hypothetical protein